MKAFLSAACLGLLPLTFCGASEAAKWIEAVRGQDGGDWSPADCAAIERLVEAVNANPELKAARDAGKLLIAPLRGPNAASRRRSLYHPSGERTQLGGRLPDSQFQTDGVHGDGEHAVDTRYDGAGLAPTDVSVILDGKNYETVMCDRTAYFVSGQKTKIGGLFVYHKNYSPKFSMGCAANVYQNDCLRGAAYPSGVLGFVNRGTNPNHSLYYFDDRLMEDILLEKRVPGPTGDATFLLLADEKGAGSRAVLKTVVIAPGLSDPAYRSLQAALADANRDRASERAERVEEPVNIWIFAGQSNSCGDQINTKNPHNQSVHPEDDWHPNVWQWARSGPEKGQAIRASHPLDFDGGGAPVGVGSALLFAKTLLTENPQQKILLIPAAVGATGFSSNHWNPGDPVYENMVSMVNAALETPNARIAGLIWCQGEGDSTLGADAYAQTWRKMFEDFKARIKGGWPDSAVVLYGELAKDTYTNISNAVTRHLVPNVPGSAYVTKQMAGIDRLTDEEKYDDMSKIHYSAKAQRLLGKAYAKAVPVAASNRK